MIHLNDPYWRRLLALSMGAVVSLAVVALVAFPLGEVAGGGSSGSAASAMRVDAVQFEPVDGNDAAMWIRVNVTNTGSAVERNVTAVIDGASLEAQNDSVQTSTGRLSRGGSSNFPFDVPAEAGGATFTTSGTSISPAGSLGLSVKSPSGKMWSGQGSGTSQTVTLVGPDLEAGGAGTYTATVSHAGGLRAISFQVQARVSYQLPTPNQTWPEIEKGATHVFAWSASSTSNRAAVRVEVTAELAGAGGATKVAYTAGVNGTGQVVSGGVGPVFLTSGEFLGFCAIAVLCVAVASGALRTRGGRARSQQRGRSEVTWHRLAWLAVLAVVAIHGTVQIASGHLDDVGAILVGVAAFAGLAGLVWFNAYQRTRVLAMEWPKWLRLKLVWVAGVLALVALHILLFGRHFVG